MTREEKAIIIDELTEKFANHPHFYVTDAAERFAKVAERFLGSAPSILEAVEIWGHDELRTH